MELSEKGNWLLSPFLRACYASNNININNNNNNNNNNDNDKKKQK